MKLSWCARYGYDDSKYVNNFQIGAVVPELWVPNQKCYPNSGHPSTYSYTNKELAHQNASTHTQYFYVGSYQIVFHEGC